MTYTFGYNKKIATLEEKKDYLELIVSKKNTTIALKCLSEYYANVLGLELKKEDCIIKFKLNVKDDIIEELNRLAQIKCNITYEDGFVHIKFSEKPYKKCLKYLKNNKLQSNKNKHKWWGIITDDMYKDIVETLKSFKYISIVDREAYNDEETYSMYSSFNDAVFNSM